VILQEIGQANDTPDDIIFDYFQERAFPDQAMGGRYWEAGDHPPTRAGSGARLSTRPLRRAAHGCWRQPEISIMTASSTLPKSYSEARRRTDRLQRSARDTSAVTGASTAFSSSCTS